MVISTWVSWSWLHPPPGRGNWVLSTKTASSHVISLSSKTNYKIKLKHGAVFRKLFAQLRAMFPEDTLAQPSPNTGWEIYLLGLSPLQMDS